MTLVYEPERRRFRADAAVVGIAGSVTAAVAPGVVVEVDLATEAIVGIQITRIVGGQRLAAAIRAAFDTQTQGSFVEEALARVVLAEIHGRETSGAGEQQWHVDRVVARLELAEEIHDLALGADDQDLTRAVEILETAKWAKVVDAAPAWEIELQRCIDTVKRARPQAHLQSTADLVGIPQPSFLGRPRVLSGAAPSVVFWADRLQLESLGARPVFTYADGILTIKLAATDPQRFIESYFCYLIDPGHDDPIIAIGQLHPSADGLVCQLRVPGDLAWARYEMIIAPSGAVEGLSLKSSRDVALVACSARSAIRLAQKGMHEVALEQIDNAIVTAAGADLDVGIRADLADIRRRIADRSYRQRFLDDF